MTSTRLSDPQKRVQVKAVSGDLQAAKFGRISVHAQVFLSFSGGFGCHSSHAP